MATQTLTFIVSLCDCYMFHYLQIANQFLYTLNHFNFKEVSLKN